MNDSTIRLSADTSALSDSLSKIAEEMTAMKSIYLTCTPRAEAPGPAESAGCRGSSPPGAFVMPRRGKGGRTHDAS